MVSLHISGDVLNFDFSYFFLVNIIFKQKIGMKDLSKKVMAFYFMLFSDNFFLLKHRHLKGINVLIFDIIVTIILKPTNIGLSKEVQITLDLSYCI